MVLPMARPWKHPLTGVYWFRKVVPVGLRARVGKREIKATLGTKDWRKATRLHAIKHAEVLESWSALRSGTAAQSQQVPRSAIAADSKIRSLSVRDCSALAGAVYSRLIELGNSDRSFTVWHAAVWSKFFDDEIAGDKPWPFGEHPGLHKAINDRYGRFVDDVLRERGMHIDEDSRNRLLEASFSAVRQAWKQIAQESGGDFRPDPDVNRFATEPYMLDDAWAKYQTDHRPQPSTVKRWKPAIEGLRRFAGSDVTKLTPRKMIQWRDKLLESGLDPITVRDVYLACVRAVLNCAKSNLRIDVNAAAGIHVQVPRKPKLREREFTDTEARMILAATLKEVDSRISAEHAAARRWVPWICAYTGARVNEITQMRGKDIRREKGVWVLEITPDAGSTKSGETRLVPIHEHLVDQGFLEFAAGKVGPLFYNPSRGRGASAAHPLYVRIGQKLAEWVRGLGITDKNVSPNHGWRHYFRTMARRAEMHEQYIDAIEGHAPGSVGRGYGSFPADVLATEMRRIPRLCFDPPIVTPSRARKVAAA
jgi:integrase